MRVIRSAGQNVSPSDDGRLFDQAFTDGLFEEATITATGGNTITLSALYGIICGRDFTAEAQTISATLPDSDTATGYVYVEFDTSSEDIISIGTALAPFTPTYEDINVNGAVVQMVIAQYEASAVAVTSVTPTYMTATAGSVKAGSIATVEKSPAVANHSIGEFILYGGDLYEVTAAIAAGETLVVGTNIAAASIGEELTALNNGLTTLLADGSYRIPRASLSPGMTCEQYVTIPTGYKFLCWVPIAFSSGWVMDFPMYFGNPFVINSNLWWNSGHSVEGDATVRYILIREF